MIQFSNPRLVAEFADWPLGHGKRGRCVFRVEQGKGTKGQRIARTTYGKPLYSTYADLCCIVDGDDGRTYLLSYSRMWGSVGVSKSDFKSADPGYYRGDDKDQWDMFAKLRDMVHDAQKQATAVAAV